jgi:hypothetical protein
LHLLQIVVKALAGHQPGEFFVVHLGGGIRPNLAAVAEHRHPLGHLQNLVEAVRDEHDGDALRLQLADPR